MATEEQSLKELYSLKKEYVNKLNDLNVKIENHPLEIKKRIENYFPLCKKVIQECHRY